MASSNLIGILLDVSGSMRQNVKDHQNKENIDENARSWIFSTFDVVRSFAKHNIKNTEVFALGVGSFNDQTFDLLETIRSFHGAVKNIELDSNHSESRSYDEILEEAMCFVEINGAPFIRRWAKKEMIKSCVSKKMLLVILENLKGDDRFRSIFVFDILPKACRDWDKMKAQGAAGGGFGIALCVGFASAINPLLGAAVVAGGLAGGGGAAVAASRREATSKEIREVVEKAKQILNRPSTVLIEDILRTCETNGALHIRKYFPNEVFTTYLTKTLALIIRDRLKTDDLFLRKFILDCLPRECSVSSSRPLRDAIEVEFLASIEKAKALMISSVSEASVIKAQEASEIIDEFIDSAEDKDDLSDDDIREILNIIEPFIYGRTPLIEALNISKDFFQAKSGVAEKKFLFVLSDGEPTDGNDAPIAALRSDSVRVICCYISQSRLRDPKRLYNFEDSHWDSGAKFLFKLSSSIATKNLPLSIFVKKGWTVELKNNETKLFIQANHPDIVGEACAIVKDIVCCHDTLGDILSVIPLETYINQEIQGTTAPRQVGGTCYANACATVLHLSMMRIKGRQGGCPSFAHLRKRLIDMYGTEGSSSIQVLEEVCPDFRLQCGLANADEALAAVISKRPVVSIFYLTDQEWNVFSNFYQQKPKGVLSEKEIDLKNRPLNAGSQACPISGHAVVLVGFDSKGLRFMNSWGTGWADGGFFRVASADVLGIRFIDVFWTLNDLFEEEKLHFERYGPQEAAQWLSTLAGLKSSRYECPRCHVSSLLSEYQGNVGEAKCPKCPGKFKGEKYLKLYLYLKSLTE